MHLYCAPDAGTDPDSDSSYQGVIRKNLELRKMVQGLEKKYSDLENERKVLILHVKELQETRDLTDRVIRDLNDRMTQLKTEMIKDPKLSATIEALNRQMNAAVRERDQLQEKTDALGTEKEKLAGELKALKETHDKEKQALIQEGDKERTARDSQQSGTVKVNLDREIENLGAQIKEKVLKIEELEKELEKARDKRQRAEEGPKAALTQAEKEKTELEKRNLGLEKELKEVNALNRRAGSALEKETEKIQAEKKKFEDKNIVLSKEKRTLEEKLAALESQARRAEEKNRRLADELQKKQEVLARMETDLNAQARQRTSEKSRLEEELRNVTVDKTMFETKVKDLEEDVFAAGTKVKTLEDVLRETSAKESSREAEIAALKEKKTELEQKLVRYIEKMLDGEEVMRKHAVLQKRSIPDERDIVENLPQEESAKIITAQSKEEIARQKLNMRYNMALAYDRMEMYEEEEKEYHLCLKINPKDANVHYNLGILYDDKLNMNLKAIEHYKKFLELRPIGEEAEQVKTWILHAEQEQRLGVQMR